MYRFEEMNPFCLTIVVEIDHALTRGKARQAAAELLAENVREYLKECAWGYGIAKVESVAPFSHPDTHIASTDAA